MFRDFKSSGRCTFMVKPTDVIPKDHMGCSLCVKAEGFQEVFNSHRSHKRTFLQPNPIAFPGINALVSQSGPKNVVRKVTAIHSVSKGINFGGKSR